MSTCTNIHSNNSASPVYYTLLRGDNPGVYSSPIFIKPGKYHDLDEVAWPICIHCGTNERKAIQMLGLHSILDVLGFNTPIDRMARDIWNHQAISEYISENPELSGPYFAVVWAGKNKSAMIYSNESDYDAVLAGLVGPRLVKHTVNLQQALVYMLLRSQVEGFQFTPIHTIPSTPTRRLSNSLSREGISTGSLGRAGSSSGSFNGQTQSTSPTRTSSSTQAITYGDEDMPPPVYTPLPWLPHSNVDSTRSVAPARSALLSLNRSRSGVDSISSTFSSIGQAPPDTPLSPQSSPSPVARGEAQTNRPIYAHIRSIDGIVGTLYENIQSDSDASPSYRTHAVSAAATEFFDAFGYNTLARTTIARLYREHLTCDGFSKALASLSRKISYKEARYIWKLMNTVTDH
uniref:Uncharacterized protein n=1 Tax=Psilocybe cubensis TaxID=181762 RepID=A0A8H7XNS3_PSICU